MVLLKDGSAVEPVSYTHLDVYKRQEDVQDQIDTMRKCYREFREKLQDFLGIDKEHDVAISREMPDCRYTGWNEQLLAEQQQESVREESVREEEPEQERQTHFRR